MFEVVITSEAQAQAMRLPRSIQARLQEVFDRLTRWPQVSGAKSLRGALKGAFRIRTGDYRVLFNLDPARRRIVIFRIADRRDVYE